MIPHFSRGRWSERSDVAWSATILNASSPRSSSEVSSSVRSRRRRSIFSAYDTPADRTAGTGCGRSSVPSCRATRSPWSCRPPTSWGDVDDVVSTDNREVHLSLGLIVLHFLRVAEDQVHVRVESVEDPAAVVPVCRSWTNTSSSLPLASPGTRLVANESKATKRPSALIAGLELLKFPWFPALSTLTRSVAPGSRARPGTTHGRSRAAEPRYTTN